MQEDIQSSRLQYKKFFNGLRERFGDEVCIYKTHIASHIMDDVANMGVHLDAITAYCFENMMQVFGRVSTRSYEKVAPQTQFNFIPQYIRNGKNPTKQIKTGLIRNKLLRKPNVKRAEFQRGQLPPLEEDLQLVEEYGFDVPACALRRLIKTRRMDRAVCEGVTITNKYVKFFSSFF